MGAADTDKMKEAQEEIDKAHLRQKAEREEDPSYYFTMPKPAPVPAIKPAPKPPAQPTPPSEFDLEIHAPHPVAEVAPVRPAGKQTTVFTPPTEPVIKSTPAVREFTVLTPAFQ